MRRQGEAGKTQQYHKMLDIGHSLVKGEEKISLKCLKADTNSRKSMSTTETGSLRRTRKEKGAIFFLNGEQWEEKREQDRQRRAF